MTLSGYFFYLILIIYLVSQNVLALKCVKCTSLRNKECFNGFGDTQVCNATQKFCVSYTGHLKQGVAVLFRACSSTNMSNFCQDHFERLSQNRVAKVLACYNTCSTNMCNNLPMGSSSLKLKLNIILFIFGILSFFHFSRT